MITVVDYGLGNIKSVRRALEKAGAKVEVSSNPESISNADGIVVCGVGAFRKAMENLNTLGLVEPIKDYLKTKRPYLGICLGLQLLFMESYEHHLTDGLGVLDGVVKKLPDGVKIPHMGWNEVNYPFVSDIWTGIKENSYFYFDHSYYVSARDNNINAGVTCYGVQWTSAIQKDNIWGVQFHPEKSGDIGLKLLKNFVKKCLPKE